MNTKYALSALAFVIVVCYAGNRMQERTQPKVIPSRTVANPPEVLDIAPIPSPLEIDAMQERAAAKKEFNTQQAAVTDVIEFDVKAKKQAVIDLVKRAAQYLQSNPTEKSFEMFSHNKDFIKGELYLFVFDMEGNCLAHGENNELIWQNLYNLKDAYGAPFVQIIIDTAKKGEGWVSYTWRGAGKDSFVQKVTKDGKDYIVGSGYYPHSKEDAVVNLVRGAAAFFNEVKAAGRPVNEAFSNFSYPLGRFVYGDLYLYALDFQGIHYAHGELPDLIGTSGWNYRDANGKLVNQEIIAKLKNSDHAIWIEYVSKNARKRAYAQKVVDSSGKEYFIACGYYPDANRNRVVDLVREGNAYMKTNGKSQAVRRFTEKRDMEFRYGDLYIFVYDMQGICLAHGSNSAFVGSNQWEARDEDGRLYVQEMIDKVKTVEQGWIAFKMKNAFQVAYVQRIDLGMEEFVIGSGLYPVSKMEVMLLLAKSAAGYLRTHLLREACQEFVRKDSKFIKGDLDIMVFNAQGICLAYGDDHDLIWRNMLNYQDDDGKFFVKDALEAVSKEDYTRLAYTLNGQRKIAFMEKVEKDGNVYAVGSSFYL